MSYRTLNRSILVVFSSLFLAFFFAFPVFAEESITQFQVEADIRADRSIQFQETITYDFDEESKHGIYRVIPTKYRRKGMSYDLRLRVTSVFMDGKMIPWRSLFELGGLRIRIGDADTLIDGVHTYQLTYETDRALNDLSEHQELYWNVTGNEWNVPIRQASFRLRAPISPSKLACYTGISASREHQCSMSKQDHYIEFKTTRELDRSEGLTIVAGLPYGTIHRLTWGERVAQIVRDNFPLGIPLFVFVCMFFIWYRWGKEPRGRGTVIPQYEEPRGLPPAMLYAMLHQHLGTPALAATMLDLARRGYLTVVFPDFILRKTREPDEGMRSFEKTIFEGIFGSKNEVKLGRRRETMWEAYQRMRDQVLNEMKMHGWIRKNPISVRIVWMALTFFTVLLSFFATAFGGVYLLIGLISAVIIALFGWNMPQMTREGAILTEEIEGFKRFLSVTEKDRLAFTDAPHRTPEQFARFLPAAIALGVEDQWSAHFADMALPMPSYIQAEAGVVWSAAAFTQTVERFNSSISRSVASSPSSAGSGGSGFSSGGGSGGGFGGGGGGSW